MLGDALLGLTSVAGVGGYRCDGSSPVRETSDVYMLQLYLRGGFHGHNGNQLLRVKAGDIVVLDLSQRVDTQVSDSDILSFIVPRQTLLAAFDHRAIPGPCVIPAESATGRILANALRQTWQLLPETSAHEAPVVSNLLLGALSGLLSRNRDTRESARTVVELATLEAIRAYIDHHLAKPNLTPDYLCGRFNCSRAHLFRLFAPVGGVANYIRSARLERCRMELRLNYDTPISEIALRWGFTSFSHFSRLFRATYGFTPKEAREAVSTIRNRATDASASASSVICLPEYRDWFASL